MDAVDDLDVEWMKDPDEPLCLDVNIEVVEQIDVR